MFTDLTSGELAYGLAIRYLHARKHFISSVCPISKGDKRFGKRICTKGRKEMVGLIVARSKNNVIGKNGEIPWKIKGEQKQFRELTTGNIVVMGRKSYEEIGHPLPNRKTIVVSRSKKYTGDNLVTVSSLQEAIKVAGDEKIYIAGGYGLYKESISLVDKMYITEVDLTIDDGDVFFPEFNANDFDMTIGETSGDDIKYTRTIYTRKK